ncbi:DNA primase [Streptomyces sp. NPDC003344]|uniref:DNA primase n=1 Tax=Streptomyces sp. NPDC003344 TaxID=3364682 RepID=UPI0036C906C9
MNTRRCERCGEHLRARHSHRARFCSTRCRVASHRAAKADAIPDELRTRDRWVRHSATKVPLTTAGRAASSTDPRTWTTYREAAASTAGVGLGFVLSDVDDIACLDLDHALNADGTPKPWAADILRRAGATYVEVSRSGSGLHVFGLADVRQGRRIRREGGYCVEAYGTGRFIAVTGRRFRGAPSTLADLSALVAALTA